MCPLVAGLGYFLFFDLLCNLLEASNDILSVLAWNCARNLIPAIRGGPACTYAGSMTLQISVFSTRTQKVADQSNNFCKT